ncbi:MAG: rhamnulokinase [Chthoniobacterales bacterium]
MKKSPRICLAADLGAGSGRVLAGSFDGTRLELHEINRFTNEPVKLANGWHWQFDKLFGEIQSGIDKAVAQYGDAVASIGVDTWGVDYGLLDAQGNLLGTPFQYRDSRTNGMQELAFTKMPRNEIYQRTGIQFLFFNTLFQLLAEARSPEALLEKTETLLFLPDLINYRLTGRRVVERSIASTGQLLYAATQEWDRCLIKKMGLPEKIFGDLVDAGTKLGPVLKYPAIEVIVPGSHDTASAVAGVPAHESEPVFLSSGTWSLMGRELLTPIINEIGFDLGFSNEAGVFGTTRYLKNIAGMWLLQECKRHWDAEGSTLGYAELIEAAAAEPAFTALLDPDAAEFQAPEHMPRAIADWLKKTSQPALETPAAVTRCILESLALKYRKIKEDLAQITERPIDHIHIVGGGSQNELLNQFAANATGCRIIAGPIEATSIGNILMQLCALGEISSLTEGRILIRNSFPTKTYHPENSEIWEKAYIDFCQFL